MPGFLRSRRHFLTSSAAMAAGAVASSLPGNARAQTGVEELSRVQGAPRLLLKGGIVFTLDRAVGDFGAADVLIEGAKIREIRPNIVMSDTVTIDCTNRILIPGFIDTHSHSYQGLLRSLLPNGLVDPDYNRD